MNCFQNEKATRQLGRPFLSRENSSNGVFIHQNLLRVVDDVVSTIKGSIELWPTLIEIAYLQKDRRGLPRTRVNNKRAG